LARLLAFATSRFRSQAAARVDRVAHALDGDQSAVENYSVAIWFVVTLACYLGFLLPFRAPFDIVAAVVIAPLSVQIAIPLVGGAFTLMGMKNNVTIMSVTIMSVMIAISSYLATATEPVRLVAWFFLFIVALNAIAWLILLPLRDRIRELEKQCGV
jgi:CO/xanthine dehydrogenase Mo-binding subunit